MLPRDGRSGPNGVRCGPLRSAAVNPDDARALVRAWWERVWREGDLDALDELLTDPFTRHTSAGSETISREAYKAKLANSQRLLYRPDTTIADDAVAGDRIWTRATSQGLNLDTGEVATITWITIHRVEDGRLAEAWIAALVDVEWDH
jgi:ketosteroid isomerase-like protein